MPTKQANERKSPMRKTPLSTAQNALSRAFLVSFPMEAARFLERAPAQAIVEFTSHVPDSQLTDVFRHLTPGTAATLLEKVPDPTARRLLTALEPNRAASLLSRLRKESQERCLSLLTDSLAAELRSLMQYPLDSAGHLMDPEVVTFRPQTTAREVIRKLRSLRKKRIQDVFLIDENGRLLGSASLQEIILSEPAESLSTMMRRDPPRVQAMSPREEVLEVLEQSRAASLPVVDFHGTLLGVLRQDELIRTARQDASADLVTMVGAGKDERALSAPLFAVRKRLPWLQINLLTAFLAAAVVGIYEGTIAQFTALAVLLPVVAGQSGNTGAQALAVTMRGLALREIRTRHWLRVASKELTVGVLNGLAVAITTSAAVFVWSRSYGLALVIAISMVLSMMIAGLAGAAIPMALTAMRQDPAQSSSIILTTVTDVVGFFSFLGIATMLMNML